MAEHQDSRCVLLSDPSTEGAEGPQPKHVSNPAGRVLNSLSLYMTSYCFLGNQVLHGGGAERGACGSGTYPFLSRVGLCMRQVPCMCMAPNCTICRSKHPLCGKKQYVMSRGERGTCGGGQCFVRSRIRPVCSPCAIYSSKFPLSGQHYPIRGTFSRTKMWWRPALLMTRVQQ